MREVYRLTELFPQSEFFGMTKQMRKSCTSVLANIAEGFGRYTYADKANKYTISRGECSETEAFLHIAVDLKYISADEAKQAFPLTERTGKLLSGLISASRDKS